MTMMEGMENQQDQSKSIVAHLFVTGKVQGVGYRHFSWENASALGLSGTVKNLPDGRVALEVEGEREKIETLIAALWQGPPQSQVLDISASWEKDTLHADQFSISV